ncbi:MAG: molybdopterin-synthase adenylyltransferase MoeB [Candidatus Omnitrophica bacterium]|nr:molybdopterin-synthase adenylyltransferase MoeB [Candidatus Omnitrophota bacterium]
MELNNEEIHRYSRHLLLPEVGMAGQKKLRAARVLCVGAGGLGSPALLYLAAAGIGRIGIIDGDTVDPTNLQRQIIHGTPDVGRRKTASAKDALNRLNPHSEVIVHDARLTSENALEILRLYDIIVDGTDNFPTRYLINDACVLLKKPNVYGAVFRFEGQASVLAPVLGGPCYRCLYPEPPPPGAAPSCAEAGVLGVLPGIVGCIQAAEAIKLALGNGGSLIGRLLLFDAWEMKFREVKLRRDPKCPICGERPALRRLVEYQPSCGVSTAPASHSLHPDEVTVQDMKRAIENPDLNIQVVDIREPDEHAIAHIAGVTLIPMRALAERITELDPNRTVYLCCRTGARSTRALKFLKEHGFKDVKSVRGGLGAWSEEIDHAMPKY